MKNEEMILEEWMNKNSITTFQDGTHEPLLLLIRAIGYSDIEGFLSDNDGAVILLSEFIINGLEDTPEWLENLKE